MNSLMRSVRVRLQAYFWQKLIMFGDSFYKVRRKKTLLLYDKMTISGSSDEYSPLQRDRRSQFTNQSNVY